MARVNSKGTYKQRPALATMDNVAKELASVYRKLLNDELNTTKSNALTYLLVNLFSMKEKIDIAKKVEAMEERLTKLEGIR